MTMEKVCWRHLSGGGAQAFGGPFEEWVEQNYSLFKLSTNSKTVSGNAPT